MIIIDPQSHMGSLIKSIIYRLCGTICTVLVSFVLTHDAQISISIGIAEMISKVLLYYLYERFWIRITDTSNLKKRKRT